jgi:hypothetical protein
MVSRAACTSRQCAPQMHRPRARRTRHRRWRLAAASCRAAAPGSPHHRRRRRHLLLQRRPQIGPCEQRAARAHLLAPQRACRRLIRFEQPTFAQPTFEQDQTARGERSRVITCVRHDVGVHRRISWGCVRYAEPCRGPGLRCGSQVHRHARHAPCLCLFYELENGTVVCLQVC